MRRHESEQLKLDGKKFRLSRESHDKLTQLSDQLASLAVNIVDLLLDDQSYIHGYMDSYLSIMDFTTGVQQLTHVLALDSSLNAASRELVLTEKHRKILERLEKFINEKNIEGVTATLEDLTLTVEVRFQNPRSTSSQQA